MYGSAGNKIEIFLMKRNFYVAVAEGNNFIYGTDGKIGIYTIDKTNRVEIYNMQIYIKKEEYPTIEYTFNNPCWIPLSNIFIDEQLTIPLVIK